MEEVYVDCPREPVIVDSAENKMRLLKMHSEDASKNCGLNYLRPRPAGLDLTYLPGVVLN